jgi:allantoin racemase
MLRIAFAVGEYPEKERKLRERVALSYACEGVEIGIVSVPASPYGGLGPAEIQLVAPYYHQAFIDAERQGYDAVVPLGMLDLGVDGGRSLVDIPVIAPCEAVFHIAAQLGDRFGVMCYHRSVIPRQRTQTHQYGMERWIAGRRAVDLHLREMADHHDQLVETFVREARALIHEDGADVIIAHGVSQCPIHIKPDWLQKELGVPVVEGVGAPIRMAVLLAGLGLTHSRVRWPKSRARPKA